jgi:excinuclease ABC subunit C
VLHRPLDCQTRKEPAPAPVSEACGGVRVLVPRARSDHMSDHPNPGLQPAPGSVPRTPGVYRFETEQGRALYVGKAKVLERRLANYFSDPSRLHPRTLQMLAQAQQLRWVVCATEAEALVMERSWIASEQPRFNVKLRDGDGYPGLAIDLRRDVPRIHPWRGRRPVGEVFGPYPGGRVRDLIDALTRVFEVRSCTDEVYRRAERSGRACLLADMGRCSAPCIGTISVADHHQRAVRLTKFLAGEDRSTLSELEAEMHQAAGDLAFELAGLRRDELDGLRAVLAHQAVVTGVADCDCVSLEITDDIIGVGVAYVRSGEIRGVRTFTSDRDPVLSTDELWTQITLAALAGAPPQRRVLLAGIAHVPDGLAAALGVAAGHPVTVRRPRSTESGVAGMAVRNAAEALANGATRRSTSVERRSEALQQIADAIGADRVPWRIECLDISHTQGRQPVASVIVLEDGLTKRSEYRRITIPGEIAGDDPRSIGHAIRRRFTGRHLGLETFPDLVVVDGGPAQVAAAMAVLEELWENRVDGIRKPNLIGMAKRLEEIWLPDEQWPVILERESPGLLVLQLARDEAHRTAIEFHRRHRDRVALTARLDTVPGLGPVRRQALLDVFGSPDAVVRATTAELVNVPGIGVELAAKIQQHLNP